MSCFGEPAPPEGDVVELPFWLVGFLFLATASSWARISFINCSIRALDGLLLRNVCPLALERALDLESTEEPRFLDLLLERFLDLLLDLDLLLSALPRLFVDDDSGVDLSTEATDLEDALRRSKKAPSGIFNKP